MKTLVSLSSGRTQSWFNKLSLKQQTQYLKDHPNSKFSKEEGRQHVKTHASHRNAVSKLPTIAKTLGLKPTGSAETHKKTSSGFDVSIPVGKADLSKDKRFKLVSKDKYSELYHPVDSKSGLPAGAYVHHDKETGEHHVGWSTM